VWASLGGVGFAAGVPAPHPDRAARRLAVLGAVTVTGANGSFIYGMLKAGDTGWADLGTLLPIAAATVLYGVFVVVERAARAPLMRLSLLSRRRVAAGAFWMLVASGVLIGALSVRIICSVPASWPCGSARPGSPRAGRPPPMPAGLGGSCRCGGCWPNGQPTSQSRS
jgi:hypothetical protein